MTSCNLAGMRILVVEDEFFLADDLCRDLQNLGAVVVGPVATVQEALVLVEATPSLDAAVLDINLSGEMVFPVADRLAALSVPFVFTSGYDDMTRDTRFDQVRRFHKPTKFQVIAGALRCLLSAHPARPSNGKTADGRAGEPCQP